MAKLEAAARAPILGRAPRTRVPAPAMGCPHALGVSHKGAGAQAQEV